MNDKRRSYRLSVELPLSFIAKENQRHISIGTTLDVSAIGICLTTKDSLAIDQELSVRTKLPNGESIKLRIKVIWVKDTTTFKQKEYKVGVKIVDTGNPDESKFIKYYASVFLSSYSNIVDEL